MTSGQRGGYMAPWGALLWLTALTAAYFLFHKPITIEFASSIFAVVWNLFVFAGIISICGGLGRRLLHELGFNKLTNMALQLGLGAGVCGLIALGLGYLGLLYPITAHLGLVLGSLLLPAGAMTPLHLDPYQGSQSKWNWLNVYFLPIRATLWGLHGSPGSTWHSPCAGVFMDILTSLPLVRSGLCAPGKPRPLSIRIIARA